MKIKASLLLLGLLSTNIFAAQSLTVGEDYHISPSKVIVNKLEAANFIISCAKAANPMSDEEGEDLVKQCQWTAEEILGEDGYAGKIKGKYTWECNKLTRQEVAQCINDNYNF